MHPTIGAPPHRPVLVRSLGQLGTQWLPSQVTVSEPAAGVARARG